MDSKQEIISNYLTQVELHKQRKTLIREAKAISKEIKTLSQSLSEIEMNLMEINFSLGSGPYQKRIREEYLSLTTPNTNK